MRLGKGSVLLGAAACGFWAAPGMAQDASGGNVFAGDYVTVGLGVGALPEYSGSDEYRVLPLAGAMGRVGGVSFRLLGPSRTTDLYDDAPGAPVTLRIGPSLRWGGNRSGKVGDPVVDALPRLKSGFEAGLGLGVGFKRLVTKYDRMSLGLHTRRDISGRGGGMTWSASMSYYTPVSRAQIVGFQVSGDFVDGDFARYNYSVTPAGSAASGLPVYRARGGFREVDVGIATVRDLNGNLLDGGFAIGAGVLYTRLHGSAAKTPITSQRGSRNQWLGGLGLAYTF